MPQPSVFQEQYQVQRKDPLVTIHFDDFVEEYIPTNDKQQINYPEHCNCTRQSILYILNQLEPNTVFDVEILETVLQGADHCRFRITKDLHFLNDNEYDLVLAMGPVYSLKDFEDRKRACMEALRIAKPGAPVFIAFCLQDAPLIHEIFQSENPASEITCIGYDREHALVTDNTGSSRILDTIATVDNLINTVCEESSARKICRFSQDGISQIISSSVNAMSEESYGEWIAYLIATAERADLMGFSDHIVEVLVKDN